MEIVENFLSDILSNYALLSVLLIMIFYYIKAKKSSHFDKQQTDKMSLGLGLMTMCIVVFSGTMTEQIFGLFGLLDSSSIYISLIHILLASGLLIMAILTFLNGIYNIKKQIKKEI